VLDKLKQWLAGESPQTRRVARKREPTPRRKPLPAARRSTVAPEPEGQNSPAALAPAPENIEQFCPNCGQPMLAAWGASCGNCRPGISVPKTLYLPSAEIQGLASEPGLCLGWFVFLQSPEEGRCGTRIELTAPISVLSRGVRPRTAIEEWFDINDQCVSGGHAIVHRPRSSDRNDSFTIRDRESPGPSANGTFVNSHKLGPDETIQLSEGDVIRLGTTELIFKSLWLPPSGPRRA